MDVADVTLAARGQIAIPKDARDALGLKPGARLSVRVQGSRLVIEKRVTLDLSRRIGKAVDDGLSTEQALSERRGRTVPWPAKAAPASPSVKRRTAKRAVAKSPVVKPKPPRARRPPWAPHASCAPTLATQGRASAWRRTF